MEPYKKSIFSSRRIRRFKGGDGNSNENNDDEIRMNDGIDVSHLRTIDTDIIKSLLGMEKDPQRRKEYEKVLAIRRTNTGLNDYDK